MQGKENKMRRLQLLTLLWVLLAAAAITAVTYAWFTFSPATNVEPMSSTISNGSVNLLIANRAAGNFDVSCTLTPDSDPDALAPVSTADLNNFYTAAAQNQEGITILYKDVSDQLADRLIHGTVYLESLNGSCDVYLYQSGLDFGTDTQALAALRLGLRITTQSGTYDYIFKLDDMADTSAAVTAATIPESGKVVAAVSDSGTADYIQDPAQNLSDYFARENGASDTQPQAGSSRLAVLQENEIASVEYWVYLEGCDDACINEVQNRDWTLKLAFAGVAGE